MYYFVAVIYVYFVCEWLKRSSYVVMSTYHFDNCIRFFKSELQTDTLYKVCDMMNHQENFTMFVDKLLYTIMVVYLLTRDIVKRYDVFDPVYWGIASCSAIVYTILGNVPLFQFSFTNDTKMTMGRVILCTTVFLFFLVLIVRQYLTQRIRYRLFVPPVGTYALSFVLLQTSGASVYFHAHHVICCGFLSLFFTQWDIATNRHMHAVMVGLIIQGINFYNIDEVSLFHVDYSTTAPSFAYITWVLCTYTIGCVLLRFRKRRCCKRRKRKDSMEIPLLVPTPEEMEAV
mgnify:CR=1 FL=1